MRDYILFIDTETSGIPRTLGASISQTEDWPFIVQLAWRVHDKEGNLIREENHYIYEKEISLKKSSTRIHGITMDMLRDRGEDRKQVIRLLVNDLRHYNPLVVGHFIEFDSKMLQVAMFRSGIKNHMKKYPHYCTMRSTSEYISYPDRDYPKLDELYQRLFGEKPERQHDASADAAATARCFFELYRRGEIEDGISDSAFLKATSRVRQKTGCGLPVVLMVVMGIVLLLL